MEKKKTKSSNVKKNVSKVEKETEVKERKIIKNDTEKSRSLGLFLPLFLTLVIVGVVSWFISSGTFNAGEFTQGTVPVRIGISNFFEYILAGMSGIYQTQVLFLAMVGIFYGIISKTSSYKAMIKKISKFFAKKQMLFGIIVSFVLVLLASFVSQPLVLVLFIPFIYSIAKELGINKISAMLITFGSLCVGIMGTTFGGYGLSYMTQYIGTSLKDGIVFRIIIALIGFFLLNGFSVLLSKKNAQIVEETFETDEVNETKAWPMIVLFVLLFVIVILGFIPYNTSFGLDAFNKFHEWLTTKVVVGEGEQQFAIFGALLGPSAVPFGSWDLYTLTYVLFIILIFVKFIGRIKFSDLYENALNGLKKMAKPMILVTFAYALFVITYNNNSPLTGNIINALTKGETFSPYLNAITGFIGAFLHVDFEYSGFLLGSLYASKFAAKSNQIVAISAAMNGFSSLFVPTSVVMLTGLSMSNISYKEWLKAIWKFLLALLIVLLLIFTIINL